MAVPKHKRSKLKIRVRYAALKKKKIKFINYNICKNCFSLYKSHSKCNCHFNK